MFDTPGMAYGMLDSAQFTRYQVPQQAITNSSWPAPATARRLGDAPPDRQVQVWARLVFEQDGEFWAAGTLTRWAEGKMCVLAGDRRLWTRYVWLDASDVRRRVLPA
jgi:hypothetical protein